MQSMGIQGELYHGLIAPQNLVITGLCSEKHAAKSISFNTQCVSSIVLLESLQRFGDWY